jgi:hypothetical protein
MPSPDYKSMLFVTVNEKYGDKYIEHLLDQYKVYLASVENVSDRRQKANEFFLALNTGLIAVLGYVSANINRNETLWLVVAAALAGMTMCFLWFRMILSYDGLNSGKFRVVHAIEERLPLALYDAEWETLGRGNDRKIYWPFTHIERAVPWIFIALYLFLLVATIQWPVAITVVLRKP